VWYYRATLYRFWNYGAGKRLAAASVGLLLLALPVSAQKVGRNSTDIVPTDNGRQSAPIRSETIVVPVRVVVRDSSGHAVGALKREDFKLFQDGKEQSIVGFTPVGAGSGSPSPGPGAAGPSNSAISPAAQPTSPLVAPATRFIALFFDDVHVKLADLMRARNAADEYVRSSLQPTDRVAIFTVSGQSQLDFTMDRAGLIKKLNALLPHAVTAGDSESAGDCPPMDFPEADAIENLDMAAALQIATQDALACAYNNDRHFLALAVELAKRTAEHLVFEYDEETEASFRRIREVVRRVSVLPGDRDVVLISPGFLTADHEQELGDTIDEAIRFNVVINTLDSQGLSAPAPGGDIGYAAVRHSPGAEPLLDTFRMADEKLANYLLLELADSTGGTAFLNNNDFNAGMRALAATPDVYYLLTYSPRDVKNDGHYHHLKVTLNVKDNFSVEARHGFYAPARNETVAQEVKREMDDALFSQDERHDLPIGLQTKIEKKASGGRQVDIFAELDVAQMHFQKTNGVNQEGLTIVVGLFDSNGNFVDGTQRIVNFDLKDATLADYQKTGVSTEMDLSVKPGVYFLRMVARDTNDQHMDAENATVDVPD
jgi:VWFA-related protein